MSGDCKLDLFINYSMFEMINRLIDIIKIIKYQFNRWFSKINLLSVYKNEILSLYNAISTYYFLYIIKSHIF